MTDTKNVLSSLYNLVAVAPMQHANITDFTDLPDINVRFQLIKSSHEDFFCLRFSILCVALTNYNLCPVVLPMVSSSLW